MEVHYCNKIDPRKLENNKHTKEYANSYRVPIEYGNKPLYINLPKLRIPFDVKEKKSNGKIFARELSLSIGELTTDDNKNNEHIKAFKKCIKDIDIQISKIIKGQMRESLYSSNPNFPPIMNVTIKTVYGDTAPKLDVYDSNKVLIKDFDVNTLRTWVVSGVIKLDGVWVQKGGTDKNKPKFGIDWVLTQLRLYNIQPIALKKSIITE